MRVFVLEQETQNGTWLTRRPARVVEPLSKDQTLERNVDSGRLADSINSKRALVGRDLTKYLVEHFGLNPAEPYWFVWEGRLCRMKGKK